VGLLDVFNEDAFSVISLTESINLMPYVPGRIGRLNLFGGKGITTTVASIEYKNGTLQLIPSAARGTMPNVNGQVKRRLRTFAVPHFPLNDAVLADEVQGVRAWGTEDGTQPVTALVNDKLESMRQSFEMTHEWLRIGALKGVVLDADESFTPIYNYFDEFGITQEVVDFDLATDDVKMKALEVIRLMEDLLGATPYTGIRAICGNNFFDALISNPSVKDAYGTYMEDRFALVQQDRENGFEFAGIIWENYRGKLGDLEFFDTDQAVFIPIGVPGLFQEVYAPADFMETVNTVGKPIYSKQERMKWDKGVELHSQSNVLPLVTRPKLLIKGINGATSESASGS
jgi:hypothetical protein